jgi:hypothetical protein
MVSDSLETFETQAKGSSSSPAPTTNPSHITNLEVTMKPSVLIPICAIGLLVGGCDSREEELEKQNAQLLWEKDSVTSLIAQRDLYFDEVVRTINEIHSGLEEVRGMQQQVTEAAPMQEGTFSMTSDESKARLRDQLTAIDSSLKKSRKKVRQLESKIRKLEGSYASLNETVNDLKKQIEERESMLAAFELRVKGLEDEVANKSQQIAQKDSQLYMQENTVYYVAGPRHELEEMGIITHEGGFLWGLLGSTAVLASGFNSEAFRPLDKTKDYVIPVDGNVEEILPLRRVEYYQTDQIDERRSDILIVDPENFWQQKYLVIITG